MASRRTPGRCACGCAYADFKTGLRFADARRMMFQGGPPPWRQKRRHSVLGFMREMKLKYWDLAHGACEQAFDQGAVAA